jgi:2-polyprenyl-3-methyl-5-hydroxy-6-metoxy-1,4-benzoquinol methylase
MHGVPGEYNIVKCLSCGLMRTNPRPTPETIGVYYPDDYGPYLDTMIQLDSNENGSNNVKHFLKKIVNRIFNVNSTLIPKLTPGRLLEVGCASGSYLDYMARKGWDVQGIEFSDKFAQLARDAGHKVQSGSLETALEPDEPFDLIVGWMVLEHLHDPIIGLRRLNKWAKPGAWMALSVPNAKSVEFNFFKDKGYALQVPTHIYHYTPQSFEKVLNAGGWNIEKIYHQRTLNNIIGSIGYVLRDKGFTRIAESFIRFPQKGGRVNYLLYPFALLLSFFGNTGRMTVWARKNDS